MNIVKKILFLPEFVKGYGMGDPYRNGEYRFIKNFIKDGMIVFDIGANTGEYTSFLLNTERKIFIHCFEPVNDTFRLLKNNPPLTKNNNKVKINQLGVGDKEEERSINIYGKGSGSNSLFINPYHLNNSENVFCESIRMTTIDKYLVDNCINKVDFIKIDVEGAELLVLKGMENSLRSEKVVSIQFEYGSFWKAADKKLNDALDIFFEFNFKVYRITPWGRLRIKNKSSKLENYTYSNYFASLNI